MSSHTIWPKLSVIIPSFNQGQFLTQALESVIQQNYPNLQLIVMDGGSTDGSVDVIKSFERQIDYWQSMPDGGQSSAINDAVGRAVGDLVCWLNSDDLHVDNALWIVGKVAAIHPNFGVYIGNGFRLDEKSQTRSPFTSRSLGFSRNALKHGLDYVQQPSTFYSRKAWEEVGGIDCGLRWGLDWDLLIRITNKYPVMLINEFLSCSREHESTKTSSGGLARAFELCDVGFRHTGQQITVGALVYLLEELRGGALDYQGESVRSMMATAELQARKDLINFAGQADGFPMTVDEGDETFVPLVGIGPSLPATIDQDDLPSISIVTPSFNQAKFLPRALASVAAQRYPRIEQIVMDGGSTDGSVSILKEFSGRLAHWESEADRGPAHAINKGFQRATGEILSWLNSDDMLADSALELVGRTFRDNPDVDVVFGNALYVNGNDEPILMDHGAYKTALYFGKVQPVAKIPAYWSYVHALPQPTVFFRKRILEKAGSLDEQYKCIFDFELFFRFCRIGKLSKIERTLGFYRIHQDAKTAEWSDFLVELYRFSRKQWPRWNSPQFRLTRDDFTNAFMNREWTSSRTTPMGKMLFWVARELLAAAVTIRLLNPEAMARSYRKWKSRRSPLS